MFYQLFRPIVFLQDPERAHERVVKLGKLVGKTNLTDFMKPIFGYENPMLNTSVCGIDFKNPVGLAAGFDKNAVLSELIEGLDFGFEEIGSVTARGGKGNSGTRLFRLPEDKALINRMGLNNDGAYVINRNLQNRKSKIPIGVNMAKTHSPEIMGDAAIRDFVESYKVMTEGDYMVLNVSCPNTKEGKTFEDPAVLSDLLYGISFVRRYKGDTRPLFVKLSPDNEDRRKLGEILSVCEDYGVSGYVLSNTSSGRSGLKTSRKVLDEIGAGGLSGAPIKGKSDNLVSFVYRETDKPIIGVSGIFNAQDAYDKIRSGASVVQGLTGFIYEGPSYAKNINKGLVNLLRRDGFSNVQEAVGIDSR